MEKAQRARDRKMGTVKGKGKVKVEFYHSETLIKASELFSGLMMGAAECVTVPMVYWHGTLPVSQGLSLPMIWKGDMARYYRALTYGTPMANFLNEDFAKKNVFAIFGVMEDEEWLWTKGKNPKSPADIKGMKIRGSGVIPERLRSNRPPFNAFHPYFTRGSA